jgi:hypothetical protein
VRRADSVVLVLTGHCLKDPEYTLDLRRPAPAIDADPSAVIRMLEAIGNQPMPAL